MQTSELTQKDGRAGSAGAWRSEHYTDSAGNRRRAIWHYSTKMLEWTEVRHCDGCERYVWDHSTSTVYTSTGHGSVSDQQAMNRFFRALEMPWYFSRKGGADIV